MAAWSGLGMNVGNNFNWATTYPTDQVDSDLDYLWGIGIRNIRIAMPNWQSTGGINNCKQASLDALAKGFYVMWGVSAGNTNELTSSNWTNYHDVVTGLAQWAEDNSLSEYQVGNELEYFNDGSITDAQIRTNIRQLGTDCQAIFTNGPISYTISQGDQNTNWSADSNKGGLDYVHINVYGHTDSGGGIGNFYTELKTFLKAYPDGQITEWLIDPTWSDYSALTESEQTTEIAARYKYIRQIGISKAYAFTWRWSGGNFAYNNDGTIRDWIRAINKNEYRKWFDNGV